MQKDDVIYRQAAINETWKEPRYTDPLNVLAEIRERLQALPSAQPERKKGRWIPMFNGTYYKCSECGYVRLKGDDNFCKECGTDMRERIEDGKTG